VSFKQWDWVEKRKLNHKGATRPVSCFAVGISLLWIDSLVQPMHALVSLDSTDPKPTPHLCSFPDPPNPAPSEADEQHP